MVEPKRINIKLDSRSQTLLEYLGRATGKNITDVVKEALDYYAQLAQVAARENMVVEFSGTQAHPLPINIKIVDEEIKLQFRSARAPVTLEISQRQAAMLKGAPN